MRVTVFILLVTFLLLAGCSKSLRYSHDEIKEFDQVIQERIKNGEIATGMSKLQVRYSWGGPNSVAILEPGNKGEERAEWIYQKNVFFKTRLIFTDDRVTEIISGEVGVIK
jgi:outer membrane biogenesis lipoprotein LolB